MTQRTHARAVLALVLAASLVAAACAEDTKVGSDELTDFDEQVQERLGEVTTTTAGESTADTAAPQTTSPPATAAAPATTTSAPPATTAPSAPAITVKIQGDAQGNAFEPSNQRVFIGSLVKFVNTDSVPHVVAARRGEFASPSIPPGGEWVYEANMTGRFEYTDERPYAVGYLEVLPR